MQDTNLLAVMGLSPAIITEIIYALCVAHPKRNHRLGEARIITTMFELEERKEHIRRALHHMASDYPDAAIPRFEQLSFYVATGADGAPLADINTPSGATAMADLLLDHVRDLTQAGRPPLHASLAGGRKTMSYHMGMAMNLLGRAEDRLSHVLVSLNAERCRTFYYPTPTPRPMTLPRDLGSFDAHQETIQLHEIPFVRLRGLLREPPSPNTSLSELIALTQRAITPVQLVLDLRPGEPADDRIHLDDRPLKLPPFEAALYALFIEAVHADEAPLDLTNLRYQNQPLRERFQDLYVERFDDLQAQAAFFEADHDDSERLYVAVSKIKKAVLAHLKESHSEAVALQYVVTSLKRNAGHTIPIDPAHITILT